MIFALFKNNILQYWDTYEKNKNQNNEETAIEKKNMALQEQMIK